MLPYNPRIRKRDGAKVFDYADVLRHKKIQNFQQVIQ